MDMKMGFLKRTYNGRMKKKQIKRRVKRGLKIALIIFLGVIILLFFLRLINSTEIDDVSPGIDCPEIEKYNPDTLYVIPNYDNNNLLSENSEWCKYLSSLNKTLRMHGITHKYREFLYSDISQEELNSGISEFEKCFGFKPEDFKPPQLKISSENKFLIKQNNLKLYTLFHQITHKVYHCGDSDIISNKLVHIF
jgi:predicted deacetylase